MDGSLCIVFHLILCFIPSLLIISVSHILPIVIFGFMQICRHQEAWLGAFFYSMDGQRQTTEDCVSKR